MACFRANCCQSRTGSGRSCFPFFNLSYYGNSCEIVVTCTREMQGKVIRFAGLTPAAGAQPTGSFSSRSKCRRIFLLSPANASGQRANLILGERGRSPLAVRLRSEGVPLGEIFSFISGLYFRGKLAYARTHADPPPGIPGVVVITAAGGLVSPDQAFTLEELREIYPKLTPSQIELASMYAKANPQRGRPRRRHLPKSLSVSISKRRLRSSSLGG